MFRKDNNMLNAKFNCMTAAALILRCGDDIPK